jgi:invasion protein IalB
MCAKLLLLVGRYRYLMRSAISALVVVPTVAFAQPAPSTPPSNQSPGGPTVVRLKPEPSRPDWTKVCGNDAANNTPVCYTTRDFVSDQGQPVMSVGVFDIIGGGQAQRRMRLLLPLGLVLQPGIRFAIDESQNTPGTYTLCIVNGCFAEAVGMKDDFVNLMKRGTNLNVNVLSQTAGELAYTVPLAGFGKAFDGPAIDAKLLAEQQTKLQEEINKRSEELRKKIESAPTPADPQAGGGVPR